MLILLYIFFVVSFGFLLFKLPQIRPINKVLKILGIGLGISFVLLNVGYIIFLILSTNNYKLLVYQHRVITVLLGFLVLFFFSFFVLLFVEKGINNIIKFHQKHNAQNLDKNPIKFVVNNVEKIKLVYKIVFFLGGFIIFYGVCFG